MNIADLEQLKLATKITTCFVDLDNTLWTGILAEGQKPQLFDTRFEVLKKLHNKGIQIYIISKNDEVDVNKAFGELELDEALFTWVIANWEPKFINIENLIRICEIRPETAVFIDDNLFELNEVKQKIPTLNTIEADNMDFVLSLPAISDKREQGETEIEERKNRYRTAIKAELSKEKFKGSDIEFYRKLKRSISFGQVPADNLDRATRLLVETHRLNFSPGKFSDYEKAKEYIHQRFNKGDKVYAITASEDEYSLGLTGVLIVQHNGSTATITDGSFSCGIIGRDFEPKTLLALIDKLKIEKVDSLNINFTLTATNIRLKEIVEGLGFVAKQKKVDGNGNLQLVYSLAIKDYKPTENYDWITVSGKEPTFEYVGHPYVIKFFDNYVKPLFAAGVKILNLGSARGEVLGLLQTNVREDFYKLLDEKGVIYTKVDMEYYPDEKNLVANAEDLSRIIEDNSQDIVMAVELLEHTQRPWLIISEMTRVCKKGGYIFISTPSFNYAKHEYPIDLWRFGPKTLKSIFDNPGYKILHLETEGDPALPRRALIMVQKIGEDPINVKMPIGKIDSERGLTVFE